MWKEKMGDTLSIETFTDHIARWVEAGFVHEDVWTLLRAEVARDALPSNTDMKGKGTPGNTVGPIGRLNKEDTVLECKIYFKDSVKT